MSDRTIKPSPRPMLAPTDASLPSRRHLMLGAGLAVFAAPAFADELDGDLVLEIELPGFQGTDPT